MFESLKMTHEGNTQVKETKALVLIQKYEAFKKEEDESVETMFSRFQILTAGLKVLDKGYSTSDHMKKIIRSLPKKWRPMVTTLKLSKNLNKITLEELIISLRSHEIELEEDEPQKKGKSAALKSNKKSKSKALQVLEEISKESSSEDELSVLSRRINQLWKHKQRKFRNYKKPDQCSESSGHRKSSRKEVVCYECKEPGHFKSDCPKFQKEKPEKKSLMATWDDSESSESSSESEDDCANMAFLADTDDEAESSGSESEYDSNEVFFELTRSELVDSLTEVLETYNQLKLKYKKLQSKLVFETEQLKNENSELKESNIKLENDLEKSHELCDSNKSSDIKNILNEYDYNFQKFLTRSIDRSKMASMIYGVSRTNRRGI